MSILAIDIIFKTTLLVAVAASTNMLLLRRASAAWRHMVWTFAVVGLLLLPVLSIALPRWQIPIRVTASSARIAAPRTEFARSIMVTDNRPVASPSIVAPADTTVPHVSSNAPITRAFSWLITSMALYGAGVCLFLIRLVVGRWTIRRMARRAATVTDPEWARLLADCKHSMGVDRPVRLLRSVEPIMPMAFGTRSPAILIPSVADTWSGERRRAVLLHELAHIAREDCFTQLMAAIACGLYWMHPGVWWVARRLRVEREVACDDRVLALDTNARDYAGHLLELAYTLGGSRAPALTVSMARQGQIEGRMLAVLDVARNRATPALRARAMSLAIAAALVVPIAAADATFVPVDAIVTPRMSAQSRAIPPATDVRLAGTWEMRPSETAQVVVLHLHERANSSSSFTIAIDQFDGLSPAMLSGSGGAAQFSLRRDAGTFAFDGTFRSGIGAGAYTFAPSATFPDELAKRGFSRPTTADQYVLARENVGFVFIDELNVQRYARPDLAELVRAAEHGVDLDYLRGMSQAGYRFGQVEALVTQRDHGIDPQYIRELGALGFTGLSSEELLHARDHGVDPAYVREMKAFGYMPLSLDALITERDHGIDPDYVRGMRQLGFQLTLEELTLARDHGIDPAYIHDMAGLGFEPLSLESLIGARNHGIDPEYVRNLRQLGYQLTLALLTTARDHGVDAEYIRGLSALGYERLSIDDLVRLRDHGVDPAYVRTQNDLKHTHLTLDELVRLRDTGGGSDHTPSAADRVRDALDHLRALVDQWLRK